ncbi:hypothetical protein BC830DRAFT_1104644 [Chytriomyces sp. MP71]|nr:hypothetical protein BC830DRAFT_1104644 [Chytriomyces sp. MP71]
MRSKQILEGVSTLDHNAMRTADGQSAKDLMAAFTRWHGAMRMHEHYEESKLYPFLSRRWKVNPTYLSSEHDEMHEKRDAVLASFNEYLILAASSRRSLEQVKTVGNELVARMKTYDSLLRMHLNEEEEFVIPMLLELSRQEFDEYYDTRAPQLFQLMDLRGQTAIAI